MITADTILDAAAKDAPELIFTYDDYDREARRLLQHWHADVNHDPRAGTVTNAVLKLRDLARAKARDGNWKGRECLRFESNGKTYDFKYVKAHDIDVGRMYVGRSNVLFMVDPANEDLYDNALSMIKGIHYPNADFEAEFSRFLPKVKWHGRTDAGLGVIMHKDPADIVVQDVIDHHRIPDRHVAWMVNRVYNITTFLEHIGIMHGGIDTHSVLVNPQMHGGILVGGWWYSRKLKDPLVALSSHALGLLPHSLVQAKRATPEIDQLLIKAFGVQCFGDPTGVGSKLIGKVPDRLLSFLRQPTMGASLPNYKTWEGLLRDEYGPPKFIHYDLDFDTVYA